jgi:hypothetical protein
MAGRIFAKLFFLNHAEDRLLVGGCIGGGVGSIIAGGHCASNIIDNKFDDFNLVTKYCAILPAGIVFSGVVGCAVGYTVGGLFFAASPITIPCAMFGVLQAYSKHDVKN